MPASGETLRSDTRPAPAVWSSRATRGEMLLGDPQSHGASHRDDVVAGDHADEQVRLPRVEAVVVPEAAHHVARRHLQSTIRRARQAEKRQTRNRAALSAVKSLVKKVQTAVADKNIDEARTSLQVATSALSKAVTKGVLKPNTASRRISRLTRHVNSLAASR